MKLARIRLANGQETVGVIDRMNVAPLASTGQFRTLSDLFEAENPAAMADLLADSAAAPLSLADVTLLAPIDRQEVWAAGVTYRRSKVARMEESEGAARFYDLVYQSDRPELFFKANPRRVAGPNRPVRIRRDARWNVPEPELALVLNSRMELVGYTIGNDMSSRDIEGENPLYLPQAKMYDGCCALGPCVTLAGSMPPLDEITIGLVIRRGDRIAFEAETEASRIARPFANLIDYLSRDNTFPDGVFLLTGTGIVPPDDFTLQRGDQVEISVTGIGTLINPVVQG
jgi:2-dehydro-3-deoxy-D-arabinonate dehydratase